MRAPRHRKLCKRYDQPYQAHHLTFSCFQRQPFFVGRQSPGWFLRYLTAAREMAGFDLWAYVIMPEHVHLVILPHEGSSIRRILHRIKRPMTSKVLGWVNRQCPSFLHRMAERRRSGEVTYRFWQTGGGYDRNLRTIQDIHDKITYIHENPVRRELVQRAVDWPWSSARAWETGQDELVTLDRKTLPPLQK